MPAAPVAPSGVPRVEPLREAKGYHETGSLVVAGPHRSDPPARRTQRGRGAGSLWRSSVPCASPRSAQTRALHAALLPAHPIEAQVAPGCGPTARSRRPVRGPGRRGRAKHAPDRWHPAPSVGGACAVTAHPPPRRRPCRADCAASPRPGSALAAPGADASTGCVVPALGWSQSRQTVPPTAANAQTETGSGSLSSRRGSCPPTSGQGPAEGWERPKTRSCIHAAFRPSGETIDRYGRPPADPTRAGSAARRASFFPGTLAAPSTNARHYVGTWMQRPASPGPRALTARRRSLGSPGREQHRDLPLRPLAP